VPRYLRYVIMIGAPLFVGAINLTHPIVMTAPSVYHAVLHHLDWWILLHLLNLAGFALLGLAVYLFMQREQGVAATLSKAAIAVFVPFYVGFDALIGIGTGVLVQYASTRPADQLAVIEPAINAYWTSGMATLLATVGSIAWGIGMVTAAIAIAEPVRRPAVTALAAIPGAVVGWGVATNSAGTPVWWVAVAVTALAILGVSRRFPAMLLALAGILFGTTHVVPLGPLGMACLVMALAWRLLARGPTGQPMRSRVEAKAAAR
jgi:hypothetical protein